MATSIIVNGKTIKRPGVYALTKSGIKNPPSNLPYGNVCIIDDGSLNTSENIRPGGSGVNGQLNTGVDSVYEITTPQQFQAFVNGGVMWSLAEQLFKPAKKNNIAGVSKIFYIKAAITTPATITYTFANGSVVFETLDEGLGANGEGLAGQLVKGYGCKFVPSTAVPGRFVVQFYYGNYKGIDPLNNVPFSNIAKNQAVGELFLTSPELKTVQELINWCSQSVEFKAVMSLKASTGSGNFIAADIASNVGFTLGVGATETYNDAAFDAALKVVKDRDNTFFLSLNSGSKATSLSNEKIFDFITNESKYEKFLLVAAGSNKSTFAGTTVGSSEHTTNYFNSDKVIVVHGQYKKSTRSGFMIKSQLAKAAMVLARICGLPPQTPVTFKSLDIDGEIHKLDDSEKEFALDKGILTTHYDDELGLHVIQQGINSLQDNQYLVNEDGTSHDIAVRRITAQLNKEICINAKKVFFGKEQGPNRNTITDTDIAAWLEGFLQSRVASTLADNLIIRFGNINVTVQADNYFVTYEFVPNYPISKIVFTGVILEN